MLFRWLSKVLKAREAARREAAALYRDYGDEAYRLARTRAREAREGVTIDANHDPRHWERVRAHLARLRPSGADTATRTLDDRR